MSSAPRRSRSSRQTSQATSRRVWIVQPGLNGQKIRTRYNAAPEQSKTLESLIEFEAKEAGGDKKKRKARCSAPPTLIAQAAEALLWLTRGLSFTAQALRRHVDNPTEELNVSFTKGYENTLSKYHGFMVRPIFTVSEPFLPCPLAPLGHVLPQWLEMS